MRKAKMDVKVRVAGQRTVRTVKADKGARVADLLGQMGHNRETVVVRLNGKIVPEEERLSDGDSVEVMTVVTGG